MNPYRLAAILLIVLTSQAFAYTTALKAPAVLIGVDRGVLTNVTLNITPGDGNIAINPGGNGTVGSDTKQSVITAVGYASSYLNIDENAYNYTFMIGDRNSNVSGPSAGLALTLLTISGFEHEKLNSNFTLTGTISPNGTVGPIGGVFDKLQAAKTINARFMLVPYVSNYSQDYLLYYLSQQTYGIPIIEVKNVSQAIPYAFGNAQPSWLPYNISTNYHTNELENASVSCQSCNGTLFAPLANFTFNFTSHEIGLINSTKFGAIKSEFYSQLADYRELASKGYLYTGADQAFLEYQTAFVFVNYNSSQQSAYNLMQNISDYCGLLNNTPNITTQNYELVLGAELRRSWAIIRLQESLQALNASQTSDDILLSLESAAPAESWCAAANEMYNTASSFNGTSLTTSQTISREASQQLQAAESVYGNQLYVQAANYSYNNGDYAAALYSLGYANVFYGNADTTLNSSIQNSTFVSGVVSNTLSSASGLWPTQFALQSYFYLREAMLSTNASTSSSYLSDAYYTSKLSSTLSGIDSQIQTNLIVATPQNTQSDGQISAQLSEITSEISIMLAALVVILVMIAAILVMLLIILLRGSNTNGKSSGRNPTNRGK